MQEEVIAQNIVYAFSAAPRGDFWLAAKQSGLQRSDDKGQSWYPLTLNPELEEQPSVTALAAAQGPDQLTHVMVGVPGGVFVSKDSGVSWSPKAIATPPPFITMLAVSPDYANDGIAFATSIEDGIFRTEDYGESWRSWIFGLFDLHVLGLAISPDFINDSRVYVFTESSIYLSYNKGRSWQMTSFPMDATPVLCMAFSPTFVQDGRIYAGTEEAGLYSSDDRGLTWQHMDTFETEDSINAIFANVQELTVLTSESIWRSEDACLSWSRGYSELDFGDGLTAALAPKGPTPGNLLLLGLADGRILTLSSM